MSRDPSCHHLYIISNIGSHHYHQTLEGRGDIGLSVLYSHSSSKTWEVEIKLVTKVSQDP